MIAREDVVKAASLARLHLTPDEVERVAADLVRVVGWTGELSAVDTTGVSPMLQPHLDAAPPRPDEARPVLGRRALEGSRGYEDGLVRVPKVID